ncbi:MAG: extracellular solute-binding protein [Streptosporangiales bacterium]|nr:extracellular solute-binding protein [Streptosporangiales bacterium]
MGRRTAPRTLTRNSASQISRSLLAAGCAATLALTACAPSTEGGSAGDTTKLTVWSWRTEDIAGYNKIFDVYEKKHPGVQVEFKAYKNTEYPTILQTGLAKSSGGPDVAQLKPFGPIQAFIEGGNLTALDGKVDLAGWPEEVVAAAKGKKDGKTYGVPFAIQTLHVLYNKKIFADNGIQVPTTWEDLKAAGDKLKKAGITPMATTAKEPWVMGLTHEIFGATRMGGDKFAQDVVAGKNDFTDPDYTASLQTVADLKPYFPEDVTAVPYLDAQALFSSGKAAMYPGGAYELGPFKKADPGLDIGFFDAPLPPGAKMDKPVTPGFADGSYGVNAKSPNQKEALELVKWMATPEFGQLFADELKQISAVPGVSPKDPLLAEMIAKYRSQGEPYSMAVHFGYGEPLGRDAEGEAIASMLLGKMDAKAAGTKIQKDISAWFKPEE